VRGSAGTIESVESSGYTQRVLHSAGRQRLEEAGEPRVGADLVVESSELERRHLLVSIRAHTHARMRWRNRRGGAPGRSRRGAE